MQTKHCGLMVNDGSSMYGVKEDNGQSDQDGAQMDLALDEIAAVSVEHCGEGKKAAQDVCRMWRIVMKGILLMVL
jgi:hypothetical protein